MGYEAFVLTGEAREMLLRHFPPSFDEFIGHHVTNRFGVAKEDGRPFGEAFELEVVGIARTDGLEALVVSHVQSTVRPDGNHYHITWSLDRSKGWKPVDSNELVKRGWVSIPAIKFTAIFQHIK